MKKQLLALIAFPVLLFGGCEKSGIQDVRPESTKTPIKAEAILTKYEFGKPSTSLGSTNKWIVAKKDVDGNTISSTRRISIGYLDAFRVRNDYAYYKYANGKMIEKTDRNFRYTYSYNGTDTAEVKTYLSDGLYRTQVFEYGANGKPSKIKTYIPGKISPFETKIFTYDSNQNNTVIDFLYDLSQPTYKLIYTYDVKGNMLTESYLSLEKNTTSLQKKFGYIYDKKGRVIEHIRSSSYLEFTKYIYTYNDDELLVKQDIFESSYFDGTYKQTGVIDFVYTYE